MYSPVSTRMPGESYFRRLRSLLYLCYVFRALINPCELILFVGYLFTTGKNYSLSKLVLVDLVTMLITVTKLPACIMMEPHAVKHNCSESTVISNLLLLTFFLLFFSKSANVLIQ